MNALTEIAEVPGRRSEMNRCPSCGAFLSKNADHCENCEQIAIDQDWSTFEH